MQIIDPQHKFYQPLQVRIAVVAVCAAWFVFELYLGPSFWLVIIGALAVYTAWVLLIRFEPAKTAATLSSPPEDDIREN